MEDKLPMEDVDLFYRLKHSLYLFANKKINAFPDSDDWRDVGKNPLEKIMNVRDYVFVKHKEIIDEFIQKNPFSLNKNELDIICSWKQAIIADKFILFKYLKDQTLFFGKGKVYGVVGLMDSFKDMFDGYSPLFIDLIILPFKDRLTHESLLMPYNISMGHRMSSSIKAEAEEAIQKYGIIASLTETAKSKESSDEDLLRFYMKSEQNRDKFWEEINKLAAKSDTLKGIYNYETARINSKHIKQQLKDQGVEGHFAVLFSQIIASGKTDKDLQENIKKMVPIEKQNETYTLCIK